MRLQRWAAVVGAYTTCAFALFIQGSAAGQGYRGTRHTGPYTVSSYIPGQHIRFEFGGGRQGYHEFTLRKLTT
jgi:hypothetical protein